MSAVVGEAEYNRVMAEISDHQLDALFSLADGADLRAKEIGVNGMTARFFVRLGLWEARTHVTHLTYRLSQFGKAVCDYALRYEDDLPQDRAAPIAGE